MSQLIVKNWQLLPSKNLAETTPVKKGEKYGYKKFQKCESCSGLLIEYNCCTECKNPVDLICMKCNKKTMYDAHEFCYCQLEVLTTPHLWIK
ncbi:MAG TPA: hypothetical protein VLF17_01665 [Candidatus Nitrosotenuis sp.]|nr:hypothetical protein [Candidatus Nitrosotenuis sp.]